MIIDYRLCASSFFVAQWWQSIIGQTEPVIWKDTCLYHLIGSKQTTRVMCPVPILADHSVEMLVWPVVHRRQLTVLRTFNTDVTTTHNRQTHKIQPEDREKLKNGLPACQVDKNNNLHMAIYLTLLLKPRIEYCVKFSRKMELSTSNIVYTAWIINGGFVFSFKDSRDSNIWSQTAKIMPKYSEHTYSKRKQDEPLWLISGEVNMYF